MMKWGYNGVVFFQKLTITVAFFLVEKSGGRAFGSSSHN